MSDSNVSRNSVSVQLISQQVALQFPLPNMLRLGSHPGSGLILCKRHHAELVGWGSAVGGLFDAEVRDIIPLGEPTWICPDSFQARQHAYAVRVRWLKFMQQLTANPVPLQRAFKILYHLEKYFGIQAVQQLSNEVLGQLVGVLPETIAIARQSRKISALQQAPLRSKKVSAPR